MEIVYNALLDFKKFGDIHPFMTEVKIVHENLPEYVEYCIVEEVYFLGFIKNRPRYNAKVMELEKNKHIRYTSQVKKNIYLVIDLNFSENKNGSLMITENFEITSNKLMGRVFVGILKKAHLKFFENLKQFLHNSVEELHTK